MTKDLKKKLLLVLGVIILFRIGSFITVPNVDASYLEQAVSQGGMLAFLNTFGGGAISNFSIFAAGVMPYITASIIIQLLSADVIKKLAEWKELGAYGEQKTKRLTNTLALIIAFIQGFAMAAGFNAMLPGVVPYPSFFTYLTIASVLTVGTAILIYLGEAITKRKVGNGISLIIFAGILSTLPATAGQMFAIIYDEANAFLSFVQMGLVLLAVLAVTLFSVFFLGAVRRIPIKHAVQKGYFAPEENNRNENHLPIKLNPANVIPVIFATAIMMIPMLLVQFAASPQWQLKLNPVFDYTQPIGMLIYGALVYGFAYFYAFILMDPKKIADNLQKSNSYIPSIRPGEETQEYLRGTMLRLTTVGGLFLVVVAVVPLVAGNIWALPQEIVMGGISILIVIGVALDFYKQVKSQMTSKIYKKYS